MSVKPDVAVAGGGPAGLAAAIALRMEGFEVAVFDAAVPPFDKACGEGLMPDGVAALKKLGVVVPQGAGFAFRGIRFLDERSSVTADFPKEWAVGVRRTVLHRLLIERAMQVGATLYWGMKNIRWSEGVLRVNGEVIQSRLVVGADGQNSLVRRDAGLSGTRGQVRRRYGFRRHYRIGSPLANGGSPHMELHWGKRCQLYITPISKEVVGVALLSAEPRLRLENALQEFPVVASRLGRAERCSREAGALTISRRLRRVTRDGLALVGDASGSVDAITGEGLGLAFHQALALAQAFKAGDLARYESAHSSLRRRPALMGSVMLAMQSVPGLQRPALAGLERFPEVFRCLLAFHVRQGSLGRDGLQYRAFAELAENACVEPGEAGSFD